MTDTSPEARTITLSMTPAEGWYLWGVVDGAGDAGAGANSVQEQDALLRLAYELLKKLPKRETTNWEPTP